MTVSIDFELHQRAVDVDALIKMRSDHFTDNERWEELENTGITNANCIKKSNFTYDQIAMSIGNYCLAEAVFSNPTDDLKDYQIWKDGIRFFPFSGKYSRLAITKQEQKKASESVKGVLGEILGGLLFNTQATILLRPIQRYPDFIGKLNFGRGWSFLEAKCFEKAPSPIFNNRVPSSKFKEVCLKAIKEIKEDKSLLFYASFTKIDNYFPLEVSQTLVEISDKNRSSYLNKKIPVPAVYKVQVVEACVIEVIYELSKEYKKISQKERDGIEEEGLERQIYERAKDKLTEIEKSSNLDDGELSKDKDCNKTIYKKITEILKKKRKKVTIFEDLKKGKSIDDFISLPENPLPMKMEKVTELNESQAIYTQLIDNSVIPKINSTKSKDWELKCFKRNKERFYLIGNSYVGVGDIDTEPQVIDKLDANDWKPL